MKIDRNIDSYTADKLKALIYENKVREVKKYMRRHDIPIYQGHYWFPRLAINYNALDVLVYFVEQDREILRDGLVLDAPITYNNFEAFKLLVQSGADYAAPVFLLRCFNVGRCFECINEKTFEIAMFLIDYVFRWEVLRPQFPQFSSKEELRKMILLTNL